ncbi:hypothetical protein GCM10007216_10560 [Thalassobacillus devorans]|uniref:Uncharacterized protein n=1 Tax=Thalassobacillus devorans TaxID=279813 RepID=A0ABQ1NSL0_9BACI|nr:hypothetical protein GCM10007216_10560 [Thalassobacillus devorans]
MSPPAKLEAPAFSFILSVLFMHDLLFEYSQIVKDVMTLLFLIPIVTLGKLGKN